MLRYKYFTNWKGEFYVSWYNKTSFDYIFFLDICNSKFNTFILILMFSNVVYKMLGTSVSLDFSTVAF